MKKILVPCDFSSTAMNALRSAVGYQTLEECEVHVLHVIELPVIHDSVLMPVLNFEESLLKDLKDKAGRTFAEVLREFENGEVPMISSVLFGPTSRVILSYIAEHHIDLVIMGTKGSSGIHEVLIGSNTEKIVRASRAPVLVVRKPVNFKNLKQIAFPTNVDFAPMEQLVQKVKSLQHLLKARINLVWINTPANFSDDERTYKKLNEFANRYMLTDFTLSIYNDIHEETGIIRFAHHTHADLIVMATHGRRGLAHIFSGSLTENIVNHIDLPVWTYSLPVKESGTLI
jgi:nucleotide-binding universal stress UspA family protein